MSRMPHAACLMPHAACRMPPATSPTMARPRNPPEIVDLAEQPGHHIRRLQQIAVAVFLHEAADSGITPVQYAALQTVANQPEVDQRTLAALAGLDTSTLGSVIDRLEARGLIERRASASDRRVRLLRLTPAGRRTLDGLIPAMRRAQRRILAPLPAAQQREFMRMLKALVAGNNELSRAPAQPAAPGVHAEAEAKASAAGAAEAGAGAQAAGAGLTSPAAPPARAARSARRRPAPARSAAPA